MIYGNFHSFCGHVSVSDWYMVLAVSADPESQNQDPDGPDPRLHYIRGSGSGLAIIASAGNFGLNWNLQIYVIRKPRLA